ncbi:MAG TPA: hypothetical protein VKA86_17085 [Candidatus Krumholzibacteria bacterium]|nr:hypothetical protein [Candidatus Krumholzibacteria bacterium]
MTTRDLAIRGLVIGALLAVAPVAVHAQPSDGHVAEDLLGRIVAPIESALQQSSAAGVVMRRPPGTDGSDLELLQDRIGNFLHERGYHVWTVGAQADAPDEGVVLDFVVEAAGFDYPSERTGFLGLGQKKVLRRGALGIRGRLEDPADGRWLWRGSPRFVAEHWVDADRSEELAADRPDWMSGAPLETLEDDSRWWERGLMAGLLAAVVVLYADGTQ